MLLSDESAVNKKTQFDQSLFLPDVVEIGGPQYINNRARSGTQGHIAREAGQRRIFIDEVAEV